MTKAAIYLRISRDRTGEGLGVDRQREDCLELAATLGWDVAESYVDNDISATSGKPRPAYRKMLSDLESDQAQAIIAWHPDRLYRRAVDLAELVECCKKHNVQVATVNAGNVDLTTPTGRLVAGLLAQVAMYEGEHKAERWSRSWRQGREQGRPARTGSRLFGYTRDGQVIAEEAAVARAMVDDLLGGVTILEIARKLERDSIQTTRGTAWRTGTVRQYLANPRIAGWSTLHGEIVAEGQWEPLVDREAWETVRGLLASRTRDTPPRVALLGGLIYCGKCGTRLVTGMARKGRRIYRCPSARPGFDGCGGTSAYLDRIEEIVESYAQARLSDPRVVKRIVELRSTSGASQLVTEAASLEARLLELEASLDEPGVPVGSITRAMGRTRERLEELQRRLAESAAAAPAEAFIGGAPWPTDLSRRRQLVAVALGDQMVYLDPVRDVAHNTWDPTRVRMALPGEPPAPRLD
jgi:site-specific DNA recombinase